MSYAYASTRGAQSFGGRGGAPVERGATPVKREFQEPYVVRPEAVRTVHLDGLVILKIIKHCKEAFPNPVAGMLLGLDTPDGILEVTNTSAYPADATEADDEDPYEIKMMKALREVNVDYNSVGWYTSTYLGSFYTRDTVVHQAEYQEAVPNAVMLVYDNIRTAQGHLSLRALRLSDSFMEARRSGRIGPDAYTGIAAAALFEELPVRIRNPHLIQALLLDITDSRALAARPGTVGAGAGAGAAADRAGGVAGSAGSAGAGAPAASAATDYETDFARLDLTTAPFLEKHLEYLNELTDTMMKNQRSQDSRLAPHMARAQEEWRRARRALNEERTAGGLEALPEEDPSMPYYRQLVELAKSKDPLDHLLTAAQINSYCSQVNRFAGQSFGKLFLAGVLHK